MSSKTAVTLQGGPSYTDGLVITIDSHVHTIAGPSGFDGTVMFAVDHVNRVATYSHTVPWADPLPMEIPEGDNEFCDCGCDCCGGEW